MKNFIDMQDYTYVLPPARIANYPLPEREQSKLLVYHAGTLAHSTFEHLGEFLPNESFLFFNDTKVIPARLIFQKETGATIEIFLLSPAYPSSLLVEAMRAVDRVQWYCAIGNLKRWTPGSSLIQKNESGTTLVASVIHREKGLVEFSWSAPGQTFAEILFATGTTPLPPYLKRKAEAGDRDRYQTVYSRVAGAVAAPTAGLHFTQDLLQKLSRMGIARDFLTLHVSAGTFLPVKERDAMAHDMHAEQIVISASNLANLLLADKKMIAVGTTSLRTMESVYWYGVKLLTNPDAVFNVLKLDPYDHRGPLPARREALEAVGQMMRRKNLDVLNGQTSIYIVPGYAFRVCDGLITNFHQPGSTLLLLVAALIGADWKMVYKTALEKDYRFLSYGDSSLLLPGKPPAFGI